MIVLSPGQTSAEIGHHFGGPTNYFWSCLHDQASLHDFSVLEKTSFSQKSFRSGWYAFFPFVEHDNGTQTFVDESG